jgi:hypothetical protein
MPARSKRSKKRSAASSTPQPDLTFFLDECLGTHHVPDALLHAGASIVIHQQHFANQPGIGDPDWIAEIAAHDWVVFTKDKSFKRRELERQAILAGGVRAFFLSATNLAGPEQAAIFVKALPRIRRLCAKHAGPFIARITRMAEVDIVLRPKK